MEDQEPQASTLPIDSFSYSWLVNFPSLENMENSTRTSVDTYDDSSSFIEMDPSLPPSRRFFVSPKDRSFKFDNFSNSESLLIHADELFRDGYVMPLFDNAAEGSQPLDSSVRPEMIRAAVGLTKSKSSCSRKFRRVSKWVLLKYLDFLTPLCRRIRSCKSSRSGGSNGTKGGLDSRIRVTRNRVFSDETASPRISVADDWRTSCDSESSIYEAVLHCKKSFGK